MLHVGRILITACHSQLLPAIYKCSEHAVALKQELDAVQIVETCANHTGSGDASLHSKMPAPLQHKDATIHSGKRSMADGWPDISNSCL